MVEPTLRTRLVKAAEEYVSLYRTHVEAAVRVKGRFISNSAPLGPSSPQALSVADTMSGLRRIEDLHAYIRALILDVPVPCGYDLTLDMKAVFTGALTLLVYDSSDKLVGEIYIKNNGGIRFEEPRARELDEMAIMEAIDGGPGRGA